MANPKTMKTKFEYVIKFLCGSAKSEGDLGWVQPVVEGEYMTGINVHNPSKKAVSFASKVAATKATIGVGLFREVHVPMEPDGVREYGCVNLLSERVSGFTEGFMVIASPVELDVVAVYTARAPGDHVTTLDVEEIQPKKEPRQSRSKNEVGVSVGTVFERITPL
jgi:hypothetical protein